MMSRSRFRIWRLVAPGAVAAALLAGPAHAYDPLSWYTVDGGGAIGSSGGSDRLSGTIGQHDAGTLTGGPFILRGGFWRGGSPTPTGVESGSETPLAFGFRAPAPNPVRVRARLSFDLPSPAEATLRVFDLSGRLVRTTDFGPLPAGRHDHVWEARDAEGSPLHAGVYFMRLEAGMNVARRRVLVLR